jgi:hypothetical protein
VIVTPPILALMLEMLPLDDINETEFEQFCFGLMEELGFVNVDWRKGTGLSSSPADSGRDIVAQYPRTDFDGATRLETWFVDCKHYKRGVPPDKISSLLAWSSAERPHVALVIASNYLSNPCKDFLAAYERNNRPAFQIRYWERPQIERLVEGRRDFLGKHFFERLRTEQEILEAEQEFFELVWYERSLYSEHQDKEAGIRRSPELLQTIKEAREGIAKRLGSERLRPHDDYEWGMINGKLSALRWMMGSEWDFLDT